MQHLSSVPDPTTSREDLPRVQKGRRGAGGRARSDSAVEVEATDASAGSESSSPREGASGGRPRSRRRAEGAGREADGAGRGNVKKKEKTSPAAHPPEPQSLSAVLGALSRNHTMAIILEHLVEYTALSFRGDEARGPRKLLLMPDGARCRAEVHTVREVEVMLQRLAAESRRRLEDLHRASVLVDRALVVPAEVSAHPIPPPPPHEGVADSDAALSRRATPLVERP
jgi:hypothetical protein